MRDKDAIAALGALAQADRLAAFRTILRSGPEGVPSGEIAKLLNIQPTRMSFHLTALERAGVLYATRDGRLVRYAVRMRTMRALLAFLTDDCCGGHPEICADLLSTRCPDTLEEV